MPNLYDDCITKYKSNRLNIRGDHGIYHWERVDRNGLLLILLDPPDKLQEAMSILRCFAYLHDCCRENEFTDPQHGQRAADFFLENIEKWNKKQVWIDKDNQKLLLEALMFHNDGQTTNDQIVGTCWDADRLDLTRVGIIPDVDLMSTKFGKHLAAQWPRLNF
jgi:uncharacterized protein